MNLEVIKPGLLTTVQDLGRWGWQRYGIVVGGALDPWAARVANVLVGNGENAAVLEIAQSGPDLRFEEDVLVAWCGADYPVLVEGRPVPGDRAVRVPDLPLGRQFVWEETGWKWAFAGSGRPGGLPPTIEEERSLTSWADTVKSTLKAHVPAGASFAGRTFRVEPR